MPRFLDNAAANAAILRTIKRAKDHVLLISPYVQLSPQVGQWLSTVDGRGVEIHLVCRVADLADSERHKLRQYQNLTVYDAKDLHAKCYANADGVVLTSLNLYDASRKNAEMGVYFDARDDADLYREAMEEARHIVEHATKTISTPERGRGDRRFAWLSRPSAPRTMKALATGGHCIR